MGQECDMDENKGPEGQSDMRQVAALTPIKKRAGEEDERMSEPVKKREARDKEMTALEQLAVVAH